MKTVELYRSFDYRPNSHMTVRFIGGITYQHVLEMAARQIERAGAGRIVANETEVTDSANVVDARNAFKRRR
jgi:hypothetical protein